MKLLFYTITIALLTSCATKSTIVTKNLESTFSNNEVIYSIPKKPSSTYLIFPEDDSVSVKNQLIFLLEALPKNASVFIFPKPFHENIVEQNSVDQPLYRKNSIVDNYQNLRITGVLDSTLPLKIMGIGEGSILAPEIARSLYATELILVNPYCYSIGQNFIEIFNEKGEEYIYLKQHYGLTTDQDWIDFFTLATNGQKPDEFIMAKPMNYYQRYWNYNPANFIKYFNNPIKVIQYSNYNFTSKSNKNSAKKIRASKVALIAGSMFAYDFKKELKDFLN